MKTIRAPVTGAPYDVVEIEPVDNQARRFSVTRATDLKVSGSGGALIKGWVRRGDLFTIFGAAGTGKSLFALDLAVKFSQRRERAYGRRLRGGPVLYVALEGEGGLPNRLLALQSELGPAPDFHLVTGALNLIERGADAAIDEIAAAAKAVDAQMVVIDTFAQATPGCDENGSREIGLALARLKRLRERSGCAVGVIDHAGWDEAKAHRTRGHSSKWAAMDAAFSLDGDVKDGDVTVTARRVKDGDIGAPAAFGSRWIALGVDEDGDEVGAWIAVERDGAPTQKTSGKRAKLTDVQAVAWEALRDLIVSRGELVALPDGTQQQGVRREIAYAELEDLGALPNAKLVTGNAQRQARTKLLSALKNKGKIDFDKDHIWPVT